MVLYGRLYMTLSFKLPCWFHSFFWHICPWKSLDVVLLKELWDMITMVESSMVAWSTTPWREINVEDMELQCKQFAKDIRVLDKEVREERRIQYKLLKTICI